MPFTLLPDEPLVFYPFAFKDRFPGSSQHLGFQKGELLMVGAFIQPDDNPITEVTATNLSSGLELYLFSPNIGTILSGAYFPVPLPPFNMDYHLGIWEIRVEDEEGNVVHAQTHDLDKTETMPYVKDIQASGDPLAPTISWRAPKQKDVPEWCEVHYRVRLLKYADDQFYASSPTTATFIEIPAGFLAPEDIIDTYVRIECRGIDFNEWEYFQPPYYPHPLEIRSETFRPLIDLIYEAQLQDRIYIEPQIP
jgi:hypothetical protein